MDQATQAALADRALAHAAAGTTDRAAAECRAPVEDYTCRARLEREREALFLQRPRVVGHAGRLRDPGDFLTVDGLGVPALVSRGADGELRAFVNACRHRGTKLVWERAGNQRVFVCPYHAWSYGCDGTLRGVPGKECFPSGTDGRDLVPLPVAERFGLVWVAGRPGASCDPAADLGALAPEVDALGLGDLVPYRPRVRDWQVNWKLIVEGALEIYHVQRAHKNTIAALFFNNLLVHDAVGPHARLVIPKRSIESLRELPRERWRLRDHANVIYYLFPSTALLVQSDHVALLTFVPLAPDQTRIAITMLIPEPPKTPRAIGHWDQNYRIMHDALDEDFVIGERIQETLRSGANTHLTFGTNELGIAHFHGAVDEALGS